VSEIGANQDENCPIMSDHTIIPAKGEQEGLPGSPIEETKRPTPRQSRFIYFWLVHYNGARAAREAGYSANTAAEIAYENLRKPHIKAEIARLLREKTLSAEFVVARLGQMAMGEIPTKTVIGPDGIKMHYDERTALENVGKAHGIFIEKHQHELVDGLDIVDGPDTLALTDGSE